MVDGKYGKRGREVRSKMRDEGIRKNKFTLFVILDHS